MAQRARAVRPDQAFEKADGEVIGVVSLELMIEEVVRAVTTQDFSGGVLQIVVNRHPTGVPNEMVTVGALIQWQDRTDAKPQPEPAAPAQPVKYESEVAEEYREYADEVAAMGRLVDTSVEAGQMHTLEDPEPDELERQLEQEAREEHDDVPIPAEAVVIGAPVGATVGGPQDYAAPNVHETPISHERPPREQGVGSGALPFQRGGGPGEPVEVNLADIAHGSTSAPDRGATAAPAGSSEGIDDGLDEASLPEEDDSSIPENRR